MSSHAQQLDFVVTRCVLATWPRGSRYGRAVNAHTTRGPVAKRTAHSKTLNSSQMTRALQNPQARQAEVSNRGPVTSLSLDMGRVLQHFVVMPNSSPKVADQTRLEDSPISVGLGKTSRIEAQSTCFVVVDTTGEASPNFTCLMSRYGRAVKTHDTVTQDTVQVMYAHPHNSSHAQQLVFVVTSSGSCVLATGPRVVCAFTARPYRDPRGPVARTQLVTTKSS